MKKCVNSFLFFFLFAVFSVSAQNFSSLAPKQNLTLQLKKPTILNSTAASDKYRTLLAVIKATDLTELLDKSGPFTIFAPSDLAFQKLSGISVEDLLRPDNKEKLKALLGYHIVAGKFSASKILRALCSGKGQTTFTTIQGDIITATMKGLDIILSDSFGNTATIVVADSNQRNGVIHEIDGVIKPGKI